MTVDVLVFGPHADDIEIGLGGTVARHATEGLRVGLCDLTRAELSSNGTPEQRLVEAEAAAGYSELCGGRIWAGRMAASSRRRRTYGRQLT